MTQQSAKNGKAGKAETTGPWRPTVSHILGEIVWLLTQAPLHRQLQLVDLEWMVMPALMHEQYYVFRDGDKPVGVAFWAKVSPEAEAKIERGILKPENRLTPEDWVGGDTIWLIDLVAPFANKTNRHHEIMIADLIAGPLNGKAFKLHQTDPKTGRRKVVTIEKDTGDKLKAVIKKAMAEQGAKP